MENKSIFNGDNVIEEVNTYILDMPADYSLGHCVAQDMRMSAGIATHFKSIFGGVGELMDQRQNVGDVAYLQRNDRFIFYLITKDLSNKKPTYASITAAITKLRDSIVKHGIKKLAIPRIGCGLDRLNWSKVKNIIKDLFLNQGCMIKVCHFTQNMKEEKEILSIDQPYVIKFCQPFNNLKKREYEKLNIILYCCETTLPVYWNRHFELVNEKHGFKLQYYKDYKMGLEVGECLHYEMTEAHIYIIIVNKTATDHFSYQNLEKGLYQIKSKIKNNQWHPTFIIQQINNPIFEKCVNRKIVSLMCSAFLELTPCIIFEIEN